MKDTGLNLLADYKAVDNMNVSAATGSQDEREDRAGHMARYGLDGTCTPTSLGALKTKRAQLALYQNREGASEAHCRATAQRVNRMPQDTVRACHNTRHFQQQQRGSPPGESTTTGPHKVLLVPYAAGARTRARRGPAAGAAVAAGAVPTPPRPPPAAAAAAAPSPPLPPPRAAPAAPPGTRPRRSCRRAW